MQSPDATSMWKKRFAESKPVFLAGRFAASKCAFCEEDIPAWENYYFWPGTDLVSGARLHKKCREAL